MRVGQKVRFLPRFALVAILICSLSSCKTRNVSHHSLAEPNSGLGERRQNNLLVLVSTAVFFGTISFVTGGIEEMLYSGAVDNLGTRIQESVRLENVLASQNENLSEIRALLKDSAGGVALKAPSLPSGAEVQGPSRFNLPVPTWIRPFPDGGVRLIREPSDPSLTGKEMVEIQSADPQLADAATRAGISADQISTAQISEKGNILTVSSLADKSGNKETALSLQVKNSGVEMRDSNGKTRTLKATFYASNGSNPFHAKRKSLPVPNESAAQGASSPSQVSSFRYLLEGLLQHSGSQDAKLPLELEMTNAQTGELEWIFSTSVVYPPGGSEPLLRFDADLSPSFLPQSVKQEFTLFVPVKHMIAVVDGGFESPSGDVLLASLEEFSSDYVALVNSFYSDNPAVAQKAVKQLESQIKSDQKQLDSYRKKLEEAPPIRHSAISRLFFLIAATAAVGAAGHELGYQMSKLPASRTLKWLEKNKIR